MSIDRSDWKVKVLAVSVLFNFLLCLGLFTNAYRAENTQIEIAKTQETVIETQRQICIESSNNSLAQHKLWEGIITLINKEHPVDNAQLVPLRALLDETFPPHFCK